MRNYYYDSDKKILGYIEDNVICDSFGKIKGHIKNDGTITDSYSYGKIMGYVDNPSIIKSENTAAGNSAFVSRKNEFLNECIRCSLSYVPDVHPFIHYNRSHYDLY